MTLRSCVPLFQRALWHSTKCLFLYFAFLFLRMTAWTQQVDFHFISCSLSPTKYGDWCIFQTWFHNQRGSCGFSDTSCKFYEACSGESERATVALNKLTSVWLFLWQVVFAPVYLTSSPLTCSFVDQGWSRNVLPQCPMSDRASGRAEMSEHKQ